MVNILSTCNCFHRARIVLLGEIAILFTSIQVLFSVGATAGHGRAKNSSTLLAAQSVALTVKALIIRLFIKCKIMALWLTELRQIFEYKPGLKHKIRVSNIRQGPNLISL